MTPSEYLDVGIAIAGGYRVARIRRSDIISVYVIVETAADVAAAARLCGLSVLTSDAAIVDCCRALGVAILMPPPRTTRVFVLGAMYEARTSTRVYSSRLAKDRGANNLHLRYAARTLAMRQ